MRSTTGIRVLAPNQQWVDAQSYVTPTDSDEIAAIVGKHGQLIISVIHSTEIDELGAGEPLEVATCLQVYHPNQWQQYRNMEFE